MQNSRGCWHWQLFRSAVFKQVSHMKLEDSPTPSFKAVLYSESWVRKTAWPDNCDTWWWQLVLTVGYIQTIVDPRELSVSDPTNKSGVKSVGHFLRSLAVWKFRESDLPYICVCVCGYIFKALKVCEKRMIQPRSQKVYEFWLVSNWQTSDFLNDF